MFRTGRFHRPLRAASHNLSGQYFTVPNLVAAGSLLTAIPTLIVYVVLQRQFVSGLTLGANKGRSKPPTRSPHLPEYHQ